MNTYPRVLRRQNNNAIKNAMNKSSAHHGAQQAGVEVVAARAAVADGNVAEALVLHQRHGGCEATGERGKRRCWLAVAGRKGQRQTMISVGSGHHWREIMQLLLLVHAKGPKRLQNTVAVRSPLPRPSLSVTYGCSSFSTSAGTMGALTAVEDSLPAVRLKPE